VPRTVARYGDAAGNRRARREAARGSGALPFSFSSPGLALLGLRRPDQRDPPRSRLA
jgi:hypothetical protein